MQNLQAVINYVFR